MPITAAHLEREIQVPLHVRVPGTKPLGNFEFRYRFIEAALVTKLLP